MGDREEMTRVTFAVILAICSSFVGFQAGPRRNRIQGRIAGRSGTYSGPLLGVRVYLLDLDDKEKDFTDTNARGEFSIIAPVELQSIRLLYDDKSDNYWRKEEEIRNTSHPHDIGERVLYSVKRRLAAVEAGEQLHLALVLGEVDPQQGSLLSSRLATDYPEMFDPNSCGSVNAELADGHVTMARQTAVPNLLNSRISANESSAASAMRTIATAEIEYASIYPEIGYADSLSKLGPNANNTLTSSEHASLIDTQLASGKRGGYAFVISVPHQRDASLRVVKISQRKAMPINAFESRACPLKLGETGRQYFYVDQSTVVRSRLGPIFDPNSARPMDPRNERNPR